MVCKELLWTDSFSISDMKWSKFYNNDLTVASEVKKGGILKIVNPKHEDWVSI